MSERNKRIRSGHYERRVALDASQANDEARTVPASLSSEHEYERWFGREVLVHDDASVDLSRAKSGLPLLLGHDASAHVIGRVDNVRIEDRRLRGDLVFHDLTDEARDTWALVRDGWMRDLSIGYRIKKWEEEKGSDLVRVTNWEVLEASVVSVPADATVGVHRSDSTRGENTMSDDGNTVTEVGGQGTVVDLARVSERSKKQGLTEGLKSGAQVERVRLKAIDQAFASPIVPRTEDFAALREEAIDNGWSEDQTRKAIMELMATRAEPAFDHSSADDAAAAPQSRQVREDGAGRTRMSMGRDERSTLSQSIEQALLVRMGVITDHAAVQDARERGVAGLDLVAMGRQFFEVNGQGHLLRGLDKHGVARIMLRTGPHTHSDFPYILANVATKIARKGYEEAPTTYQDWANIGSLPDFKQAYIPGLGSFSDLNEIPLGGGKYEHGTMADINETATLKTYGRLFGISRAAIVNDDLNQFARAGIAMGAAAARKVNYLAYQALIASASGGYGQTMTEDSTALFHANHGNYIASGSGGEPSVTTMNAAEAAMMKARAPYRSGDTSTAYLNIRPAHLIVAPEKYGTADVLATAMYDPTGTTSAKSLRDSPNRWKGRLTITADAQLSALNSGLAWIAAAPKGNSAIDTVTVFFLEGQQGPYTEEQDQFDSDGRTYKVRIDAVARALDYRGLYLNFGS